MLLQQNFLELRQLCFHEVLIRWFSTWVAHWETTKVVSGVACRKLPGFSKHVFFKAQERSCPKPIKNRGKGHDNVCLLFLISADGVIYVICKSHLVLVAVPTQVFFFTQGPKRAKVLIWSSTDLPNMAPRSERSQLQTWRLHAGPIWIGRDWTWTAGDLPNCHCVLNQILLLWPVYRLWHATCLYVTSDVCATASAEPSGLWVGRRLQACFCGFVVEETCGGSWCLWKFYRSKAIINHPYTMINLTIVNQKPELSREITVNWSHFVSGIIPRFVTRYDPRI